MTPCQSEDEGSESEEEEGDMDDDPSYDPEMDDAKIENDFISRVQIIHVLMLNKYKLCKASEARIYIMNLFRFSDLCVKGKHTPSNRHHFSLLLI